MNPSSSTLNHRTEKSNGMSDLPHQQQQDTLASTHTSEATIPTTNATSSTPKTMDNLMIRDPNRSDESLDEGNDLSAMLLGGADNNNDNNKNGDMSPYLPPISDVTLALRRAGHFLGYITIICMLILVPWVVIRAINQRRVDWAAFHSSEVMVFGTVILSLRQVYLHLSHWHMPDVQKYVVRILWMVPLYAVQSYLSLRLHNEARIYICTLRDLYEAYVIASFFYYLMELLGGSDAVVRILQAKPASLGAQQWPLNYIVAPWEMGLEFMLQCKHGVLQYVVVKTVATLLTFICESLNVYGEGQFSWRLAYPYLAFFLNISVMYALYCLVKLFHAVNDELCRPVNWRPLGKFLCIKGVVFFTWWQGIVIFYLKAHGIIVDFGDWEADEVANALIDYCICVEMVAFAIAHSFTFTHKEYLPSRFQRRSRQAEDDASHEDEGSVPQDYVPPMRTLDKPMDLRKALSDSIMPKETLKDIRKLRRGVDGVMNETMNDSLGAISLSRVSSSGKNNNTDNDEGSELRQRLVTNGQPNAAGLQPPSAQDDDDHHVV